MGFRDAVLVNLFRVFLIGILFSTWLNPVFLLSLGGAIVAIVSMGTLKSIAGTRISMVGVSVFGAWMHMITQFGLVALLIVRDSMVLLAAIPSLFLSIVAGTLTGIISLYVSTRLPERVFKSSI